MNTTLETRSAARPDDPNARGSLRESGVRHLVRVAVGILLQSIVLFVAAGRVDLQRTWLFAAVSIGCFLVVATVVSRISPEIINQRGMRRPPTKWWDRQFLVSYVSFVYVVPLIAGLDVGRFQWFALGIPFAYFGVATYLLGQAFVCWAVVANPHFEPTVRIQEERNHRVVTSGPYRVVRHPGYAATIASIASVPWIIGSGVAMVPAGIIILLLIVRTALEDRTLKNELGGYAEYAEQVRYRLLPLVW